jgi:hypothetical protein
MGIRARAAAAPEVALRGKPTYVAMRLFEGIRKAGVLRPAFLVFARESTAAQVPFRRSHSGSYVSQTDVRTRKCSPILARNAADCHRVTHRPAATTALREGLRRRLPQPLSGTEDESHRSVAE